MGVPPVTDRIRGLVEDAGGASQFLAWLEEEESVLKRAVAEALADARKDFLASSEGWVKKTLEVTNAPFLANWRSWANLKAVSEKNARDFARAMRALWDGDSAEPVGQRVSAFVETLPFQATRGFALSVPSVLLMAWGADDYPPLKISIMRRLSKDQKGETAGEAYERHLAALDGVLAACSANGIDLRSRLDAQGVIWQLAHLGELPKGINLAGQVRDTQLEEPEEEEAQVDIYRFLSDKGYLFPNEVVTNFLLSLLAKPFVIFSGISGTGKTKLAELLSAWLVVSPREPTGGDNTRLSASPPLTAESRLYGEDYLPKDRLLVMRLGWELVGRDGDWGLSESHAWEEEEIQDLILPLSKFLGRCRPDGRSVREWANPIIAQLDDFVRAIESRCSSAALGTLEQKFIDLLGEIGAITNRSPDIDWRALERVTQGRWSEFTAKYRDGLRVPARSGQSQFISVRPDWTDARTLFGFKNILKDNRWESGPAREFLLAAAGLTPKPAILVLDEMNLARVEHYFSDMLSGMEAKNRVLGNVPAEGEESLDRFGGLPIPGNAHIVGTVNVDESTYMFSPKVLDRANTIEFNEVDLAAYKGEMGERQDGFRLKDPDLESVLEIFREVAGRASRNPTKADYEKARVVAPDQMDNLEGLHGVLLPYHMHFGYRVLNEVARYLVLTDRLVGGDKRERLDTALDLQVLQKVLPKFHGSRKKLEDPLREVLHFAWKRQAVARTAKEKWKELESLIWPGEQTSSHRESLVRMASKVGKADGPEFALHRTARKVMRMLGTLEERGFTSFVE